MIQLSREQFLVGITTTDGSDWQGKIEEANILGLEKVAVFLTCLKFEERQKMYKLLEKSCIKEIPFVHLRSDMENSELDYLVKQFSVKVFNLHSKKDFPWLDDYASYKSQIFIENVYVIPDEHELDEFAGICLDFSHLENFKLLKQPEFQDTIKFLGKYKIGCNHISAVGKESHIDEWEKEVFSKHFLTDLSELDYLKQYPKEYFSGFCAIELENSLAEQLKVIEYIINILDFQF